MNEEWRPVVGWEKFYEVSNIGRVRSLPRVVEGRILSPNVKNGYPSVVLSVDGNRGNCLVHRLVADAFVGSVIGLQVNHKDFNRSNNCASNLEVMTPLENIRHSLAAGRGQVGEGHHRAKLSLEDVRTIRRHGQLGVLTSHELAHFFDVGHSTINKIKTGKIWRRAA